MIIHTTARNGQPVQVIKTLDELTEEEKGELNQATIKDYKNFHIIYDKHGNLKNIKGYELTDEYLNRPQDDSIDLVDSMQLLYGKKHSHNYESAKKRIGASDEEIDVARRIVKGNNNE